MTYAWDNDSTQNAHIKQMRDLNTCRIMGKEQSMGLIDADALKKDLESVTLSNVTLLSTNTVLLLLDKYPTAYDVDAVVEQLKETKAYMLYENMNADVKWIDKAIEIVKVGGNIELSEHSKNQGDRTGK